MSLQMGWTTLLGSDPGNPHEARPLATGVKDLSHSCAKEKVFHGSFQSKVQANSKNSGHPGVLEIGIIPRMLRAVELRTSGCSGRTALLCLLLFSCEDRRSSRAAPSDCRPFTGRSQSQDEKREVKRGSAGSCSWIRLNLSASPLSHE